MHIIEIGILASPAKKKQQNNNNNSEKTTRQQQQQKERKSEKHDNSWMICFHAPWNIKRFIRPTRNKIKLIPMKSCITKILPQSKPISIRKFNEMGEYTVWVPKWTILLNDNEIQTKNDAHINANRMYSNRCWNVRSWESNQNTELIWNGIKITCKIKRTYWKPFLTLDPRSDIFDIPNRLKHEIDFLFSVMYSSLYFGVKRCSEICIMHTVRISCNRFLYMNHFSNVICLTVCT